MSPASLNRIYAHPHRAGTLGLLSLAVAMAWGGFGQSALANPAGGVAVVGQAAMATQGSRLTVTTQNGAGGSHSAINWQSFSIPTGSSTYFQQPNAASTVINRVVTNTPSAIFGSLGSNGALVLVNQAGIAVGAGAVVDTAGFTASTLRMSDADALASRLRFGDGSASGALQVDGRILARSGDVVLIGSQVRTGARALIQAPDGATVLAAGQQVEVTGRGLEGIRLTVQAPGDVALNLGTLSGNAVGIFAGTLRHSGLIQANAVSQEGGKVVLRASDQLSLSGTVAAQGPSGAGGSIRATAPVTSLEAGALLDVSALAGGGEILIGGGYQGKDASVANAANTSVAAGVRLQADATGSGHGGTVVVWSDGTTRFDGSLSARGGALGGNGGAAEVSGRQRLVFGGMADLAAPAGLRGSLLLDPENIAIGGSAPDMTAATVATLLASADLNLTASNDITVHDFITKPASMTASTLTLQAGRDVNLNAGIASSDAPLNLVVLAGRAVAGTSDISTRGGNVNLTAQTGDVDLYSLNTANAGGTRLDAGNVTIQAGGNLSVTSISAGGQAGSSGAGGRGGNVLLTAAGLLNVNGSIVSAGGSGGMGSNNQGLAGGAGGTVTLQANATSTANTSNVGAIDARGGAGGSGTAGAGAMGAGGAIGITVGHALNLNDTIQTNAAIRIAATGDLSQVNSYNISNDFDNAPYSMDFSGASITLRSVQSRGNIGLTASAGVNLLATGSGNFIDDTYFTYHLPFAFNFFGTNYTDAFITTNGLITFGSSTSAYTDSFGGMGSIRGIAPAWNDWILQANIGKDIRIASNPSSLSVVWDVGRYYDFTRQAKFESVLKPDGSIRFNYGAATESFAGDVTIGLSNGSNINLKSGLMNLPNFSMNNLVSTTFTPSAGSYIEAISATSTPVSSFGTVSGSAILGQGSGRVLETTGALTIQAGGVINAPSDLSAQSLQFFSVGGANFTGDNSFASLGASRNRSVTAGSSSGDVVIYTASPQFTMGGLVNDQGGVAVTNSGGIAVTGTVSAAGSALALTAQGGPLSQTAPLIAGSLTTSSAGGTTLADAGNQFGSVAALNGGSGDIVLRNTGALTIADLENPVGRITLTNTGNVSLAGPVNAGGDVSMVATSLGTTAGSIGVTGGNVHLQATGGPLGVGSISVATGTASGASVGGSLLLESLGDLSVTGLLASDASGTPVVVSSTSGVLDFSAAGAGFSVPDGTWQIYLNDPRGKLVNAAWVPHRFGEVAPDFKQYGVLPFSAATPSAGLSGTGNALLYAYSPPSITTLPGAITQVYDGTTAINLSKFSGHLSSTVDGEQIILSGSGSFSDRNVGSNKTVTPDAGSSLAASTAWTTAGGTTRQIPVYGYQFKLTGTITARPASNWIGPASGLWSVASNWDALPDASNVLSVSIPAGTQVTYDTKVGNTSLQTLSSAGALLLIGGTLNVASDLNLPQYSQTGGTLSGQGGLVVSNSFAQSGGAIQFDGPVSVTQRTGPLAAGPISASSITLAAPDGSISQAGPLVTRGLISATAKGSITLKDSGNRIGRLLASSTGTGDIDITTFGVLNVQGLRTADGSIFITDTGGVATTGPVVAKGGSVHLTANSPLNIGIDGIVASGDVVLIATNQTSAGNMVLDGDVTSSSGSVWLYAASDLQQNSEVTAALDVTAAAGGKIGFGPAARSVGNPVSYKVNGITVAPPAGSGFADAAQTSAPVNFVVAFLSFFEESLLSSSVKEFADAKPEDRRRKKETLVLDKQTCTP